MADYFVYSISFKATSMLKTYLSTSLDRDYVH